MIKKKIVYMLALASISVSLQTTTMDNKAVLAESSAKSHDTASYKAHNEEIYRTIVAFDLKNHTTLPHIKRTFKECLAHPLTDFNYVVTEPSGAKRFLWQIIREDFPNTTLLKKLRKYEKTHQDSPEIQLCKACVDLNNTKIVELLPDQAINVNFSKEGTKPPLVITVCAVIDAIGRLFRDQSQDTTCSMKRAVDAMNTVLECGRCDVDGYKDHMGNNLLHIAVLEPHVLNAIVNRMGIERSNHPSKTPIIWLSRIFALNNEEPAKSPLTLAAGRQPSSVDVIMRLLQQARLKNKVFERTIFNRLQKESPATVCSTLQSRLMPEYKRSILFCLVEHGVNSGLWNKHLNNSAIGWVVNTARGDLVVSSDLFYALLALGAPCDASIVKQYEEHCDEMTHAHCLVHRDELGDQNIKLQVFSTYCRKHALLGGEEASKLSLPNPTAGFTKWVDRKKTPPYKTIGDAATYIERSAPLLDINCTDAVFYRGNNITSDDYIGITSLMWAAARGDEQLAKRLLKAPGIIPNVTDNRGNTALHYAVFTRHSKLVELLLAHKAVAIGKKKMKLALLL